MKADYENDWELTTAQLRAVVRLRKLYSNYPDALGTKRCDEDAWSRQSHCIEP